MKVLNNAGSNMFSTDPQIGTTKFSSAQSGGGGVVAVVNGATAAVSTGDVLAVVGVTADASAADRGLTVWLRFV